MHSKKLSLEREKVSSQLTFKAGSNDNGRRLDTVVRHFLSHLTLSTIHKAIRKGDIRLNGQKSLPQHKILEGDILSVWRALAKDPHEISSVKNAENSPVISSWIVAHAKDLFVINKPSRTLVHTGDGSHDGIILEPLIKAYLRPYLTSGLSFSPGPLHRLDYQTSGLLIFSASLQGAQDFSFLQKGQSLKKFYLALVEGHMRSPRCQSEPIARSSSRKQSYVSFAGSSAQSIFTPLAYGKNHTLVLVQIASGRTHQIRLHAQMAGHPLSGDIKYGGRKTASLKGWFLHAWAILFPDERFGWKNLLAPIPSSTAITLAPLLDLSLINFYTLLQKISDTFSSLHQS